MHPQILVTLGSSGNGAGINDTRVLGDNCNFGSDSFRWECYVEEALISVISLKGVDFFFFIRQSPSLDLHHTFAFAESSNVT